MSRRSQFTQGKNTGTHFIGGWVGPRAGEELCGKISPLPGFDPQTLYVASLYTDCAIPISLL